ncbi:MAG: ATP-binding protein [Lachnospiraceae bacterium]|nr:ATP-binding protein [Lachnospiraceae bacterium]
MIFEPIDINNIKKEYEQTRQDNQRMELERRREVFEKCPAYEELDNEATSSYISLIRDRISGGIDSSDISIQSIKDKAARKKQLLREAGFPENFLDPIYTCSKCEDTGFVGQERCSCFREKLVNKLYLQSNLSNILEKENFSTFNLDYYSKDRIQGYDFSPYDNMTKVLSSAKSFVENFGTSSSGRGNILIYGEVGLGKTFLTNCIAKGVLDKGHKVFYLSSNELFQNILSPYLMNQEKALAELYKYVYTCELLIIDDLGTELINSFTLSNLFEIINQRNIHGLSTLISTNLGLKDLKAKYSERIMSRLVESYTVYNIYGDNIRYQKRFNSTNI